MARSRKSRNISRWVKRHQNKHLCKCGCGEYIIVKREHHKLSVGIPSFIKGHNRLHKSEEAAEEQPKKDSVWDRLAPEEQQRRLDQLKSFGKRENNPAWKGGRRVDENGYVQILMPDHPFAKDGYMAEHRFLVEERTKKYDPDNPLLIEANGEKYLSSKCIVHHVDEVKTNNDPGQGPDDFGNLMLLPSPRAHAFIHNSPLPMKERLRRISIGVFHSRPLVEDEEDINDEN
jgi:hypothetical protein